LHSPGEHDSSRFKMELIGLHHVSLNVRDLKEALSFYTDVLKLRPLTRPDLGKPGAWFAIGDGRQLHLIEAPDRPAPRGQHMAFVVRDVEEAASALRLRGQSVQGTYELPGGARQCFIRDPTANLIELYQLPPQQEGSF
jgi:glyoxylase I family protein